MQAKKPPAAAVAAAQRAAAKAKANAEAEAEEAQEAAANDAAAAAALAAAGFVASKPKAAAAAGATAGQASDAARQGSEGAAAAGAFGNGDIPPVAPAGARRSRTKQGDSKPGDSATAPSSAGGVAGDSPMAEAMSSADVDGDGAVRPMGLDGGEPVANGLRPSGSSKQLLALKAEDVDSSEPPSTGDRSPLYLNPLAKSRNSHAHAWSSCSRHQLGKDARSSPSGHAITWARDGKIERCGGGQSQALLMDQRGYACSRFYHPRHTPTGRVVRARVVHT